MTDATAPLWLQLLDIADSLNHAAQIDDALLQQYVAAVATLAEGCDRQFDPADNFKEYVLAVFVKSAATALQWRGPLP